MSRTTEILVIILLLVMIYAILDRPAFFQPEGFTDAEVMDGKEDPKFTSERIAGGSLLLTDNDTGCQYIINNGITPRGNGENGQICAAPLHDPMTVNHGE